MVKQITDDVIIGFDPSYLSKSGKKTHGVGYFTAWVDTDGELHFYQDVYDKDEPLAALLFNK